jgi:hypothetical protein
MTDRQLLQQALDALEGSTEKTLSIRAMKALRERLAHCDRCGKRLGGEGDIHTCTPDPIGDAQSALIAEMAAQPEQEPVAWVSLQWLAEMILSDCGHSSNYTPLLDRVKARIAQWERANSAPTPPAAQQEPTEYLYRVDVSRMKEGECTKYDHPIYFYSKADANNYCWTINQAPQQRTIVVAESHAIKIATPPAAQRQWVGLTKEDIVDCLGEPYWDDVIRKAEAKLKEKNT